MRYDLGRFIEKHDTDGSIKESIANCISENMTKEISLDLLSNDLQETLYSFIWENENLDIDDGSNVERDFTQAIKDVVKEKLTLFGSVNKA